MFRILKSIWNELTLPPPPRSPSAHAVNQDPPSPPPPAQRASGYPESFDLAKPQSEIQRTVLFEPALRHYTRAFRHGEPVIADPQREARWLKDRQAVVDHILQTVGGSPWRECLVLRGSTLMKAWFGDRARPPGDIDWVVWPHEFSFRSPDAKRLLDGVLQRLHSSPCAGDAVLRADRAVVEDIWTYERAPGRRIVIPWQVDDEDQGTIQMDFVFEEPIPDEPTQIDYPLADGRTVRLTAVGPEASLIWKLVWLETDVYAQGKDLFDAVLLTELATPKLERLYAMLQHGLPEESGYVYDLKWDFPLKWDIDWKSFQDEYPQVPGTAADWQRKLTDALRPMFEAERS